MPTPHPAPLLATYRLQFNKDFTFQDATKIVDYLADLGITHVYASPILSSKRGSTHGYDVTDPTRLNPELGTEADFSTLREKLVERGLGLILDIVPNHMSASSENAWWMDVLENGPESAYASYFDIDWHPPSRRLEGKVLLPVLGRPFSEALEHQEFKLVVLEGKFLIQYFESLLPLAPSTYHLILRRRINELREALGDESPAFQEYSGIAAAASALAEDSNTQRDAGADRRLRFETLRQRLRQLIAQDLKIGEFVAQNLKGIEGRPKDVSSFSSLESILAQQHYILAYWQNVNEEINYRRFFTINDLVGQRMQDPLVFEATHALVFRMIEQNILAGLRIDHIDGLRDPLGYLQHLSERLTATNAPVGAPPPKNKTVRPANSPLPVFVEKILARDEELPNNWPVAGTTGYDFVNALNAFFIDPKGAPQIEKIYSRFLGKEIAYDDLLYQKKKLVMSILLGVEIRAAGQQFQLLARDDRYAREIPRLELNQVLIETTAQLSVYRTYIRNLEVAEEDKRRIEQAIHKARAKSPQLSSRAFDFLRDVLLILNRPHLLPGQREARLGFVMRWQQFTGPIMAKAFEDTFLYVFTPLVSLNEVGGDPRPSTAPAADFPGFITVRQKDWPHAMNATTTHDTKRGEDIRARVNVLSEIPGEWQTHLERWSKANAAHRKLVDGQRIPDPNEEIFLYETLLGAWLAHPDGPYTITERLKTYVIKATREAMVHTRWTRPNLGHERALEHFISAIVKPSGKNKFLPDFIEFQKRIAFFGMANGLAQTLIKIASPGVPDFYQGSDLWDFRLVDPDNRQPVDFAERKTALTKLKALDGSPSPAFLEVAKTWRNGEIKLYVIWKALQQRAQYPRLYSDGEFLPIEAVGRRAQHVAAFARRHRNDWALVVVPRWLARAGYPMPPQGSGRFWSDTAVRLPKTAPLEWRNIFTNEQIKSAGKSSARIIRMDYLSRFPVALLTGSTIS
ncbi:MAG: malto-oligosyltrehalose synthase [Candidatus Acidiferrum sp.]